MDKYTQCDSLEALNDALCREQESHDFFIKASKRTLNTKGAEMFLDLAEQAQVQIHILEDQIEALTANNIWMLPECVLACKYDLETYPYPRDIKTFNKEIRPDLNDMNAIIYALSAENANYGVYIELAKITQNSEARQFYTYLAEHARLRIDMLMLNYEFVSLNSVA